MLRCFVAEDVALRSAINATVAVPALLVAQNAENEMPESAEHFGVGS